MNAEWERDSPPCYRLHLSYLTASYNRCGSLYVLWQVRGRGSRVSGQPGERLPTDIMAVSLTFVGIGKTGPRYRRMLPKDADFEHRGRGTRHMAQGIVQQTRIAPWHGEKTLPNGGYISKQNPHVKSPFGSTHWTIHCGEV